MLVLAGHAGNDFVVKKVVKDFPALVEYAKERTLPRLLAEAQSRFSNGEALTFGDLALDEQGLNCGAKSLSWTEIESLIASQGLIRMKKRGKRGNWNSVPVSDVPNSHVLIALVQARVGAG